MILRLMVCVFLSLLSVLGQAQEKVKIQAPKPVSYYREVLPIFRTACIGCHGETNAAGSLTLTSYAAILKGGKSGVMFTAGKGADSRLVKMLLGTIQPKMPPGGGGLKQIDIDRVRLWIDGGAKMDTPPVETTKKPLISIGKGVRTVAVAPKVVAPSHAPMLAVAATATALAFSPDSKTLAVGTFREVQFWDVETHKLAKVWSGHADTVRTLVFSKDGKTLVAGGGLPGAAGEVKLWDVVNSKETLTFGSELGDVVTSLGLSVDGKKIVTGSIDKTVRVWETATGKLLQTLREHSDAVTGVAFSPDGKYFVSSSADRSLKVWDANSGKRLYSVGAHDDVVTSLDFSPNGRNLLTTSTDRSARVWNFGTDSSGLARSLLGHSNSVLAATFASDSDWMATASADKSVKVWKMDGGNPFTFTDPKDWVYVVRFSPDKTHLAAGTWDGQIYLWTLKDGKLEATLSTLH